MPALFLAHADASGPVEVNLPIRAWTTAATDRNAHSRTIQAVKEAFERAGIAMVFPRRDIRLVRGRG